LSELARSPGEGLVRQEGVFFICRHCDTTLTVTEATLTQVSLISATDEPQVRVVQVDGTEVHRCIRRDLRRNGKN
jgi:hypothetical protein